MKLKPNRLRITLYFLLTSIILLLVIVGMCFTIFFYEPFGYKQIIILAAWLLLSLVCLLTLEKNYYFFIDEKYISVVRFNKEVVYQYNEIIYIDIEYSEKHSNILFITKHGHARYILHDREKKMLGILKDKCRNLKDRESVVRQFPNLCKTIR